MKIPNLIQNLIRRIAPKRFFCEDALITTHNHDFIHDERFNRAYARGVKASGEDYNNRWRVHVILWVAGNCEHLPGDFVELGVNYGYMSSAVLEYLGDSSYRLFWLVDSFEGRDVRQVTEAEASSRYDKALETGFYNSDVERVRENFDEWSCATVVKGWVPDCLREVRARKIAFLHIDLNCAAPEIAAFEYFWRQDMFCEGAMILLDDYAYTGHGESYYAWNCLAERTGFTILSLPTGQGLIQL